MTRWGLIDQDTGEVVAETERLIETIKLQQEHPKAVMIPLAEEPQD